MARSSINSLSTLRSRIWLQVTAFAIFICVGCLLVYSGAKYFSMDSIYIVAGIFAAAAIATSFFGRWLAEEVLKPVEKVGLLTKSMERSSSIALPTSTGAAETDDLLNSIHRNLTQVRNLTGLMEDVAAGKTSLALAPLENADRISEAFQKMVARVTDSVDAKIELDKLRSAVGRLNTDVTGLKTGNLNANIHCDSPATIEIAEAIRYLIAQLNEISLHVRTGTTDASQSINEVKSIVQKAIEQDEASQRRLNTVADSLKEMPSKANRVINQVSNTIASGSRSFMSFSEATAAAKENISSLAGMRKQLTDMLYKIQAIRDQSKIIPQVAKSADDLARRSKMIAINAAIRSDDSAAGAGGISLLADEIKTLSLHAEDINKNIAAVNSSTNRDLNEAESLVQKAATMLSDIASSASENHTAMVDLNEFITQLQELPAQIEAETGTRTNGTEDALRILTSCTLDSQGMKNNLNACDEKISKVARLIENMKDSTSGLRTAQTVRPNIQNEAVHIESSRAAKVPTFGDVRENSGRFNFEGESNQ